MVAQTKADARNVAVKPDQANKKWLQKDAAIDSREILDEQASAAAVVDAEQAQAVAANAVPTEGPGIGLVAQATTTTTTDTAPDTTTTAVETTPPPVAEESTGVNPWVVGGAALLGVGAVVAIADNNDDDDPNPPVGEEPPPAGPPPVAPPPPGAGDPPTQPPAPVPAPVPPTSTNPNSVAAEADGVTALSAANFPFTPGEPGDTLTTVRIGSITPTNIDTTTSDALAIGPNGHGYELVQANATWAEASAAAAAKGGYLAVLDTAEELAFVKANLGNLGLPTGEGATWIGLSQSPTATAVGEGWTWVDGTPLAGDSPLWSNEFGGLPGDFRDDPFEAGNEGHEADFGAISEGGPSDQETNSLILDTGIGAGTDALPQFLIEYNTTAPLTLAGAAVTPGQVIAAADLPNLTWNSVFNSGGAVTFAVGDPQGDYSTPENTLRIDPTPAAPVTSLASMIDDQSAGNFV